VLVEIEDKLAKVLQERLAEVPKENIGVDIKIIKTPSIIISNLKFDFENTDLSENWVQNKIKLEERFNCDGVKSSYKLREKPLKNSLRVEYASKILSEKNDYLVSYTDGVIEFRKAPEKGKGPVLISYHSCEGVMTLKSLKVTALYSVEVTGEDRFKADSLAEEVVKVILKVEDQFLKEGIKIVALGGNSSKDEKENTAKVQLRYSIEKEIRVEQVIQAIESIELTSKKS
jgi:hypothetical protein